MSNINFENNNSKRTDSHGTFIDKPIRPKVDNGDIVTWADLIDWGEFDLTISSGVTPANSVENTYESFINALKLNFSHLLSRIQSLENGGTSPEIVLITGITLNINSFTLSTEGATRTVTATISPANASNQTLQWSSSNTGVATVNSSGKVTAVGKGTATITCKSKDGSNIQATCTVTCDWADVQPTIQYTVEFDTNGGSGSVNSRTCTAGTSITLPTYSGTKSGYSFAGWCENPNGTGDTYSAGTAYYPNGNIKLYAKWEEEQHSNNYFLGETAQEVFTTSDLTSYQATKPSRIITNASLGDVVTVWIYPASWGEPTAMMNNGDNDKTAWTWNPDWLTVPNGYTGAWIQTGSSATFDLTW